jgi:hypothetical protein
MAKRQINISLPFPSTWYISIIQRDRLLNSGRLYINSITNNVVTGRIDFNVGGSLPFQGQWDERRRLLTFRTGNSIFTGNLTVRDEYQPRIRHFILNGTWNQVGDPLSYGTWRATTARYF